MNRATGIVLVAALCGGALSGCAADESRSIIGHYAPDDAIVVKNQTIDAGTYLIGYTLRLRVESSKPGSSLVCSIVDTSGNFGRLEQTTTEVAADSTWSNVEYAGQYSLPDVTIGIRCSPSVEGEYSITVSDVSLSIDKPDR